MRVLVTGGAGFIGHHLVRALVERGDGVAVIDDFSSGKPARLESVRDRIELIDGSILDRAALDRAIEGAEVVFHEAAVASVAESLIAPVATNEVNVTGTIEVVLAAARHHVRRVILAASCAVYGVPERLRTVPTSPYGASKLAAEHYLHTLGASLGVETVALRYFNVFGPGQDPASEYAAVVPKFISAALRGDGPTINGSGGISRDFVYVDNVVAANLLAALPDRPSGLTCNVGSGSQTTLLQLLDAICEATGGRVQPVFGPARAGDIPDSLADIGLARRALGYEPAVSFEEGIARTVAGLRSPE